MIDKGGYYYVKILTIHAELINDDLYLEKELNDKKKEKIYIDEEDICDDTFVIYNYSENYDGLKFYWDYDRNCYITKKHFIIDTYGSLFYSLLYII
jgi:hypothetical protein